MSTEEQKLLVEDDGKKDKNKIPIWHQQQELILKNWSEIGSSYRYLHDRSFTKYNKQNLRFALPVIVISTITGTANFAQESFPEAWKSYVPLAIGFLNLTAGLITTIGQFLRVSELLEGHRAASIAYSKFSRNISVELSLPVAQRTSDGYDFIVTCRNELDRLIEQSPNIPAIIVREFASRFADSPFFKPDILDITPVTIYKNDEEAEAAERERIIKKEKEDRLAIIREEEERRQSLIKELQSEKTKQEFELTKKIEEIKKNKKNTIGFSNVEDNLDRLLEKIGKNNPNSLDTSSDEHSQMSTIINDLVKPTTMSKEKVQSIIEEKLNVTPAVSPSSSITSNKSNQIKIEIKDKSNQKEKEGSQELKKTDSKNSND
tara:strand:+ start:258 stop:1385 length:1128 start_codon:yes stop_codon:yes gene_type:complete